MVEWDELVKIREWTKEKGIKMHLDGCRIWEAQPFLQHSFAEIAELFDSVFVSFYKGIGGLSCGMLLGESEFIQEAKIW